MGLEPTAFCMASRFKACGAFRIRIEFPVNKPLLGAAAEHARCSLVFSYPRRNAATRVVVAAQRLFFRLRRSEFRTFTHPPFAMLAVLGERGLRPAYAHEGAVWQVAGLARR